MILKVVLKMSYNTSQVWIQILKEVSEQNVSLVLCQRRFGATFQCSTQPSFSHLLKSMSSQCLVKEFPIISFQ